MEENNFPTPSQVLGGLYVMYVYVGMLLYVCVCYDFQVYFASVILR